MANCVSMALVCPEKLMTTGSTFIPPSASGRLILVRRSWITTVLPVPVCPVKNTLCMTRKLVMKSSAYRTVSTVGTTMLKYGIFGSNSKVGTTDSHF